MDEALLEALDATSDVQERGRSAVLREAAAAHLETLRKARIAEQYRMGYASDHGLGEEFAGWEDEGSWPES